MSSAQKRDFEKREQYRLRTAYGEKGAAEAAVKEAHNAKTASQALQQLVTRRFEGRLREVMLYVLGGCESNALLPNRDTIPLEDEVALDGGTPLHLHLPQLSSSASAQRPPMSSICTQVVSMEALFGAAALGGGNRGGAASSSAVGAAAGSERRAATTSRRGGPPRGVELRRGLGEGFVAGLNLAVFLATRIASHAATSFWAGVLFAPAALSTMCVRRDGMPATTLPPHVVSSPPSPRRSRLAPRLPFSPRFPARSLPDRFVPTMAGDEFAMILAASDIVGWYKCPNGHPYSVGACTRPMQLARCPACNAKIGGQNHEDVQGVTRLGVTDDMRQGRKSTPDRARKGYNKDDLMLSATNIRNDMVPRGGAAATHVLRIFMHLLLHLHGSSTQRWQALFDVLRPPDSSAKAAEDGSRGRVGSKAERSVRMLLPEDLGAPPS